MKLSIIIPLYNAEKYIGECLDSILESDLPKEEYEVIVVNDGSKDGGPEIVQSYVTRRPNVMYLTQENQGQSVARNYGIREAKGEYIWCVDSDDKVEGRELMKAYMRLCENPELDIMAFQLQEVTEDNVPVRRECTQPSLRHEVVTSGRDAIVGGYNPSSVCALFVRRQMIIDNGLFFREGITHQDVELSYRIMATAGKVLFTDIVPYVYILHPGSTSKAVNPVKKIKYLTDDIIVHRSFLLLAEKYSSDAELAATVANRANNILFSLLMTLRTHRHDWGMAGINKAVIEKLRSEKLYPLSLSSYNWKKRFLLLLLNREWFVT